MKEAPGYRIKIHSSLISPILFAGVPRAFAILNGTIAAAFTLALHVFYLIPVFILLHVLTIFLTKKDPEFLKTGLRHLKQISYYDV